MMAQVDGKVSQVDPPSASSLLTPNKVIKVIVIISLILLVISGFSSCVLKYYNCSESLTDCRQQFNRCSVSSASVSSEQVTTVTSLSAVTTASVKSPVISETGDVYTPSLAQGTGKIPESKIIILNRILLKLSRLQF